MENEKVQTLEGTFRKLFAVSTNLPLKLECDVKPVLDGKIRENAERLAFVLAGNAYFTIENTQSGNRFTFRVSANKKESEVTHWVCVLTGPDNLSNYTFIGFIKAGEFFHSRKGGIGNDAQSVRVFAWFFKNLKANSVPEFILFWHMGRCCRCGRALTVPESVAAGIGPECASMVSGF